MKKRNQKVHFKIILYMILILTIFYIVGNKNEFSGCIILYADEIILLPKKGNDEFTCTGLYYDKPRKVFLIGNAGKSSPEEKGFRASVEVVNGKFSTILKSIDCFVLYDQMRDIQGVCIDNNDNIWICSCGENKVRQIDFNGEMISEFSVGFPSGIAYDSETDTLWILTNKWLGNYLKNGELIEKVNIKKKGQDQLFLDTKERVLYFSVGSNYQGDSYIYIYDIEEHQVKPLYVLKDSYAIEGISIVNGKLYVLNDGYYHNAKVSTNQVNIYYLDHYNLDRTRVK